MRTIPAFCLSLVLVSSSAIAVTKHTIDVDGQQRHYLLHTPSKVNTERELALVVVLHGGGGTARGIYRETGKRFAQLADRHGFFVVYPNAVRRMWDFGAGKVSAGLRVRTDDRRFFEALLEHLTTSLPIDPRRVFATGISRGGQASYFLACQFPERIRAIAPVTMPMPEFMVQDCRATGEIGLALINGTADPLVPYAGGDIRVRGRSRGRVLSTAATVKQWRQRNGCQSRPSARRRIDTADDGTYVERSDWTECRGAPVRRYRIVGGGHTWPSGRQYLSKRAIGPVSRDIDGATEVWDFFSTFK